MFKFDRDEVDEDAIEADEPPALVRAESSTSRSLWFGCSFRLGKESRVTVSGSYTALRFDFIVYVE
jgi:hypothetical protein